METLPPVTAIASASAFSFTPSPRLNRVSCAPCFRRRRRSPRCCFKQQQQQADVEDGAQREAKDEEVEKRRRVPGWLSLDRIGLDILSIAVPAALALAADPIAALVDTAFVGHLGEGNLLFSPLSVFLWRFTVLFNDKS
jgi:hypothetical protein